MDTSVQIETNLDAITVSSPYFADITTVLTALGAHAGIKQPINKSPVMPNPNRKIKNATSGTANSLHKIAIHIATSLNAFVICAVIKKKPVTNMATGVLSSLKNSIGFSIM